VVVIRIVLMVVAFITIAMLVSFVVAPLAIIRAVMVIAIVVVIIHPYITGGAPILTIPTEPKRTAHTAVTIDGIHTSGPMLAALTSTLIDVDLTTLSTKAPHARASIGIDGVRTRTTLHARRARTLIDVGLTQYATVAR